MGPSGIKIPVPESVSPALTEFANNLFQKQGWGSRGGESDTKQLTTELSPNQQGHSAGG